MAKPSIFSRDYEKKMRQRKIKIAIGLLLIIVIVLCVVIYMKGIFKDVSKSAEKTKSNVTTNKDSTKKSDSSTTEQKKISPAKEEGFDIQLTDGRTVKAVYESKDNQKTFKVLSPSDSNVIYDISPSKQNLVIYDDKAQSIILVDINGTKQDITNPQYTSTNGSVTEKNAQISSTPGYIWCASPKFIDENNIAYISQLPWIGKTSKYVWIENIQSKNHVMVQGIEGQNLKLDSLTEKGLTVIADDKTHFLTADGNVTQ